MKQIDRSLIDTALSMSPEPFLRHSYGNDVHVSRSGHSISVEKVLRADKKSDGKWVSCTWIGDGIGDNIKLMNFISGLGFIQAVEELTGQCPFSDEPVRVPVMRRRRSSDFGINNRKEMSLPKFITDNRDGQDYLMSRGISQETIDKCEANGILGYTDIGVCFLGRNEFGTIKYIAHRYYEEQPVPDKPGKTRNKKDEYGSSKAYCFSIEPTEKDKPYHAFIVEGAINAMALADINSGIENDAVKNAVILTTGSVASKEWLSRDSVKNYLRNAVSVIMIGENEDAGTRHTKEEKQTLTDSARHKVIELIKEVTGIDDVKLIYPPKGFGDIADYHLAVTKKNEEKVMEQRIQKLYQTPAPALENTSNVNLRRVIVPRPDYMKNRKRQVLGIEP